MVEQAVEDGGGHHRVAKDLAPLGDVAVAGDQQTATLVAARDKLEEQVRGTRLKGQVAQFIDDQELGLGVDGQALLQATLAVGLTREVIRAAAVANSTE